MMVSVGVLTYNQEDTIRQTLESIVCQIGDFNLEVVVGDDHSQDDTRTICEKFAEKYTKEGRVYVNLLPDELNKGIMGNFARVMQNCHGEFVGMCAGDDYWCDELKLRKQLGFFNSHPDVGVVSTSGYKLLVRENHLVPNAIAPMHPVEDGNVKPFFFSKDYRGGVYAAPLSLLIRKEVLDKVGFDEFVRRGFPVEDYPMQAVMSQFTRWGHIPDMTVVYRVYKESATFVSIDHPQYLQYHCGLMEIRRYLNELFPEDACFSEEWMLEYEFYKKYLLCLHKRQYVGAKDVISQYENKIPNSAKLKQAKKQAVNRLSFMAFACYKDWVYKKELKKRT